jgi:hypothetical protein
MWGGFLETERRVAVCHECSKFGRADNGTRQVLKTKGAFRAHVLLVHVPHRQSSLSRLSGRGHNNTIISIVRCCRVCRDDAYRLRPAVGVESDIQRPNGDAVVAAARVQSLQGSKATRAAMSIFRWAHHAHAYRTQGDTCPGDGACAKASPRWNYYYYVSLAGQFESD